VDRSDAFGPHVVHRLAVPDGDKMIGLADIAALTGGRVGTLDVPCPECGPFKRSPRNRRRPVLRVWQVEHGFATFFCARCGEKGYARDEAAPKPDPVKLARARQEAAEHERHATAKRLREALWLWSRRQPIAGSPVDCYLREARGYRGPLPPTLAYLPAHDDYPPAMIAAFGLADEIEPGAIVIRNSAIRGVHLTRLLPDGSDRERGDGAKIMIGHSAGSPIVVAPINDLGGLAVTEGIEDALSTCMATGLGCWAAGCASRLPALAGTVPHYVESLTICAHSDDAGQRGALELAAALSHRPMEIRMTKVGDDQ
jgi:hypothetical protein